MDAVSGMEEAFDVNAFHYLVKPVDEEKFSEVFGRAWKEAFVSREREKKYIMVKSSGVQRRILLKNIYYIESRNKKVIIHTTDKTLEIYGKMEDAESRQYFVESGTGKKSVGGIVQQGGSFIDL